MTDQMFLVVLLTESWLAFLAGLALNRTTRTAARFGLFVAANAVAYRVFF